MPTIVTATELRTILGVSSSLYSDNRIVPNLLRPSSVLIFFVLFVASCWRGGIIQSQLRKDREMTDHNGWTNYATSRVYNEIFKYMDPYDDIPDEQGLWPRAGLPVLTLALREYVQDLVYEAGGGDGNIAVDYALAFLSEVNWFEIAECLFLEYADAEDREEYKKDCTNSVNNVL